MALAQPIAPQWIKRVSWVEQSVSVDLTRDALKQAPWYDPSVPLAREMEAAVYDHYGRAGYLLGSAQQPAMSFSNVAGA
jgi:hypothetical protein